MFKVVMLYFVVPVRLFTALNEIINLAILWLHEYLFEWLNDVNHVRSMLVVEAEHKSIRYLDMRVLWNENLTVRDFDTDLHLGLSHANNVRIDQLVAFHLHDFT